MSVQIVHAGEMPVVLKSGFSKEEVLTGTHPLVRPYKFVVEAGKTVRPGRSSGLQVFCFIKGTGYICTRREAFNVREVAFFIPEPEDGEFSLTAVPETSLEGFVFDVGMTEADWEAFDDTHNILPWFKSASQGEAYTQTCKGPNTKSWLLLGRGAMARILFGIVRAEGEGTREKGHPEVDQWNVTLEGSDFELTVENDTARHGAYEISYVPAGLDHSLIAEPGHCVHYIWFEHEVEEHRVRKQSFTEV